MRQLLIVTLLCSSPVLMRADFNYTETTQMTGGSLGAMMRSLGPLAGKAAEPIVTTHIVKGNRMVTITRGTLTITDLDQETITTVDNDKKQYSVTTFAEMKERLEQAMQRAQGRKKGQDGEDVKANFKVSAKATGKSKTIQGLTAKEMVLTVTTEFADAKSGQSGAMDMVTDSWVAPLPGYEEVREFNKKLGAKIGAAFGAGMQQMAMMGGGQGNMGQSMEELAKEMQKMDGMPVESVTKMGPAGSMTASSSAAPAPASGNAGECTADSQSQEAQRSPSAAGALAGALGGKFGGFGRAKKTDKPAAQSQPGCNATPGNTAGGALMEMTMTLSSFSSAPADASKFEIPAGYKQVKGRNQ
jgi:hypothetical protein